MEFRLACCNALAAFFDVFACIDCYTRDAAMTMMRDRLAIPLTNGETSLLDGGQDVWVAERPIAESGSMYSLRWSTEAYLGNIKPNRTSCIPHQGIRVMWSNRSATYSSYHHTEGFGLCG